MTGRKFQMPGTGRLLPLIGIALSLVIVWRFFDRAQWWWLWGW